MHHVQFLRENIDARIGAFDFGERLLVHRLRDVVREHDHDLVAVIPPIRFLGSVPDGIQRRFRFVAARVLLGLDASDLVPELLHGGDERLVVDEVFLVHLEIAVAHHTASPVKADFAGPEALDELVHIVLDPLDDLRHGAGAVKTEDDVGDAVHLDLGRPLNDLIRHIDES